MIRPRATSPGSGAVSLRDRMDGTSTATLPDEVVNQRVIAKVWMSSRPDRKARWGVGVWMDREQADDGAPFTIDASGWRGMDGVGLTPAEAIYVAGCLRAAADRILNAGAHE